MIILIDNGHGHNTHGKRSTNGKFLEATYTREIARRVVAKKNFHILRDSLCPAVLTENFFMDNTTREKVYDKLIWFVIIIIYHNSFRTVFYLVEKRFLLSLAAISSNFPPIAKNKYPDTSFAYDFYDVFRNSYFFKDCIHYFINPVRKYWSLPEVYSIFAVNIDYAEDYYIHLYCSDTYELRFIKEVDP